MWLHRNGTSFGFATAISQVTNEFLTSIELRARRLIPIEIAYQTNAQRDVVQIIAVHVTAIDLTSPAVADLDLTISGRCAVADYEMIRQTVLHPTDMSMV